MDRDFYFCGIDVYKMFILSGKNVFDIEKAWKSLKCKTYGMRISHPSSPTLPQSSTVLYSSQKRLLSSVDQLFYTVSTAPIITKTKEKIKERY